MATNEQLNSLEQITI